MAMHDWTRVPPNVYQHFHGRWLYAITDSLNSGLLPPEYYALLSPRASHTTRPATRRLTVRNTTDHRAVAVVAMVSPGDKETAQNLAAFAEEAAALFADGVNLTVIDPFPPTVWHPGGAHGAVWDRLGWRLPESPIPPPAVAGVQPGGSPAGYITPFAVGDPVPTVQLLLDRDKYLPTSQQSVTVPLEDTYRAAWPEVPAYWRQILEA